MAKPITIPNSFTSVTTATGGQLDADFSAVASAINDPNTYQNYLVDTGVANSYVVTFPVGSVPSSYSSGLVIQFKPANNNSGSSTINVNSLGAKNILRQDGTNLQSGDINTTGLVTIQYDGTNFIIQSPVSISVASTNVRQTVLSGTTSSGLPSALSIGTGLAVNLSATANSLVLSAAKGFGANGALDQIEVISSDATGIVTLPASNLSFIYRIIASAWGSTLAPPQYGYTYNQAAQSCLSLNNISTDDFGNSWTNTGVTFANTTPKYAGTFYGVFGATSTFKSTSFTSLGNGGWTLRVGFYSTSIATTQSFLYATAATYGIAFNISTSKLQMYLSSTGSSWDLASGVLGNTTLSSNTWYDLEATYDPIAGKYFVYLNGVAESNLTITSASKVCPITGITLGASAGGFIGNVQGFEFKPYCAHPAGTSFTPQTALANVAASGYASDWFDLNTFTMKSVSAASASAGVNPTFASSAKVYVAESVTGASTVTSVTNYAYQGRYDSQLFPVAASTTYSKNHNIGIQNIRLEVHLSDDMAGTNERQATHYAMNAATPNWEGWWGGASSRNIQSVVTTSNVGLSIAGALISTGYYRMICNRGW